MNSVSILEMDLKNTQLLIAAAKFFKIKGILPTPLGSIIKVQGKINNVLHLPGISEEMTQYFTDKLQVHLLLQDKCNQAQYVLLNECDLSKPVPVLSSTLNFPVIVKPRYGSGSRGVNVAYTKDDLQRAVEIASQEFNPLLGLPKDLLIEEFLSGTEYSCYGILLNHQLYAPNVIKKSKLTALPYRQEIAYFTSPTAPKESVRQAVIEQVQSVTQLLQMNDCLVVSDVLVSKNQPYVLDIAGRHCGYNLIKFLKYQDIDYLQLWYRYILNHQAPDAQLVNWHQATSFHSWYMHFLQLSIGIVRQVPSLQQVQQLVSRMSGTHQTLVEFDCKLKNGDIIQIEHDGRICANGYIILRDLEETACEKLVQQLLDLFIIEPLDKSNLCQAKGSDSHTATGDITNNDALSCSTNADSTDNGTLFCSVNVESSNKDDFPRFAQGTTNSSLAQATTANKDAAYFTTSEPYYAASGYTLINPDQLQTFADSERNIMCFGLSMETLPFILSGVTAGYNVIAVGQKNEAAEQELLTLLYKLSQTLPALEMIKTYKISMDSLMTTLNETSLIES